MIVCENCGRKNEATYRFCLGCGSLIKPVEEELKASEAAEMPAIDVVLEPVGSDLPDHDLEDELEEDLEDEFEEDLEDELEEEEQEERLDSTDALMAAWANESVFGINRQSLKEEKADRICSQCGMEVSVGYRFCGNCGSKYEEKVEATKTDMPASPSSIMVDRISFISNEAVQKSNAARFSLTHINEDGSTGEGVELVEGENIIGRASSAALAADNYVSPKHFVLTCTGKSAELDPYGSLNGVFIRYMGKRLVLYDGLIFRIGEELLQYIEGDSRQAILKAQDSDATLLIGGNETEGWGYVRVILGAYAEGCVYRLNKERVEIGRVRGDIIFDRDGFVSANHVALYRRDGVCYIEDLNSSNGTFVRLRGKTVLQEDSHILVGNQLMHLRVL